MRIFIGTKNFTLAGDPKLACSCGCGMLPDADFMDRVQLLRDHAGFALPVTSCARCGAYNNKVSGTGFTGPHTTGKAIDFGLSGSKAYSLTATAIRLGFTGIGISQKGPHEKRFIHVDDLPNAAGQPRPTIWSY